MFSNIINALSVWFLLTYPWNGNTSKWDMNIIKLPFLVFVTVDLDWDTEPFSTDTYTNIYIQEIHMLHQIHGLHTLDGTLCSGALSVCVSVIASACCFFLWGGGVFCCFFFFFFFLYCVCVWERESETAPSGHQSRSQASGLSSAHITVREPLMRGTFTATLGKCHYTHKHALYRTQTHTQVLHSLCLYCQLTELSCVCTIFQ